MKRTFLIFVFSALMFSCKKENPKISGDSVIISQRVSYNKNNGNLILNSGKFQNIIPENRLPFRKVILLNSSLIGYFTELGLENKLTGISSPEYIFSGKIHHLISKNKIQNIGNEQKYDIEKILADKPDVIFTNYVPNFENTYNILKKNGIEVIFLDEYMEQNPLEKSKYLLLFGKLFGIEEKAENKYNQIVNNYNQIKNWSSEIADKPTVLCNEMYGSQWFLPGGNSFVAKLISDSGGNYILKNSKENSSVPLSFEEVLVKSENAKYWINISPHKDKKELLNINPNYEKMKIFQNGKLFMINNKENGNANDYFESGVVRCDLVLRDYFKIFHPENAHSKNIPLVYMKELK